MIKKTGAGGEIYDDNYMGKPLSESYGIDVVDELTSILSQELSNAIDAQIIKDLIGKKNPRIRKIRNILKSFE